MINFLEYSTTTAALKAAFQDFKIANPSLAMEQFAKRLGIGTSTLKMLLSGGRKPSVHHMLCLARGLRLSLSITEYLKTLALKEDAKNTWEKAHYAKILNLKKQEVKISMIPTSQTELLADPIILPLLVYLMDNKKLDVDYSHLARELKTSASRISELIQKLQNNKILNEQNDGSFHVTFDKFNHRPAQKQYQKHLLMETAKRVETEYDLASSQFFSYVLSATDESLVRIRMEINDLFEKYMAMDIAATEGKLVAQACFQIFPVIRCPRRS